MLGRYAAAVSCGDASKVAIAWMSWLTAGLKSAALAVPKVTPPSALVASDVTDPTAADAALALALQKKSSLLSEPYSA